MPLSDLKGPVPKGFDNPTALPQTADQEREWQDANRMWWETHPMRYDFSENIKAGEFKTEFYKEVDDRFFSDVKTFMPWKRTPFDPLVDFDSLHDKDVLEVGVGNGSHAQLISSFARSYTGIDLTKYAVESTTKRLQHFALDGPKIRVIRMDAEDMSFPDNSFDLIWSWGVIHHSANTRKIVEEIHRVLKPGGIAITMVYHRNLWNYYVVAGLCVGIFQGALLKSRSLHQARQQFIDGALARYYTIPEWKHLVSDLFAVKEIRIYGSKAELIPLPAGRLKAVVKSIIPNGIGRQLTNRCKMGMFLVSTLKKPTSLFLTSGRNSRTTSGL